MQNKTFKSFCKNRHNMGCGGSVPDADKTPVGTKKLDMIRVIFDIFIPKIQNTVLPLIF